jgi:hypothetical protein
MTRLSDGRFDVLCRDGHHETVTSDDIQANRVCKGGPPPGHSVILYGRSDSCGSSDLGAYVDDRTNCATLGASTPCWSVSINGTCVNITDTTLQDACRTYQGAATAKLVIYGRSDSCGSDDLAAYVGDHTDCASLSDSAPAWSISVDGQCQNIDDTNVRAACAKFKGAGDAHVIVYGRSDSCDASDLAAFVSNDTDCSTLSTDPAWSVSIDGACQNIEDTTVPTPAPVSGEPTRAGRAALGKNPDVQALERESPGIVEPPATDSVRMSPR